VKVEAASRAHVAITSERLELDGLVSLVSAGGYGAVATFLGLVRDENQHRRVKYLEYEAYEPLAVRALERILAEAREHWPAARVACHHRIGRLQIGEASVAIAAASPHRADAFAACRYVIERVKQIVPIWKHEHFDGGEVWIEGAVADPHDEARRVIALERARGERAP
jgi:molybdopterin synthase catalytic subunit